MALPEGLQAVALTGRYLKPDGTADAGTVRFSPSPTSINSAATDTVIDGTVTATLDADGRISVTLLATDSTGITPTGWTYLVVETLASGGRRSYSISLPAASPAVDLADVAPVSVANGVAITTGPTGATGPQGPTGPAGANGADGWGTQADYDTLAGRVSAVEAGFATVNGYITDALNRIAALETRIAQDEVYITDALNRVASLETRVTNLENP